MAHSRMVLAHSTISPTTASTVNATSAASSELPVDRRRFCIYGNIITSSTSNTINSKATIKKCIENIVRLLSLFRKPHSNGLAMPSSEVALGLTRVASTRSTAEMVSANAITVSNTCIEDKVSKNWPQKTKQPVAHKC